MAKYGGIGFLLFSSMVFGMCAAACKERVVDLGIVLDSSGSESGSGFIKQKQFAADFVSDMQVGPNTTLVGAVTFGSNVYTSFNLNTYDDINSVVAALNRVNYDGGSTDTAGALEYMRSTFFTVQNGNRPEAVKVILIMTDGSSDNRQSTLAKASQLKNEGIILFAVGIGNGLDMNEINGIATYPDMAYQVKTFQDLKEFVPILRKDYCKKIDPCEVRPCYSGSCANVGITYRCDCYAGWKGANCSEQIDYCEDKPCVNGSCSNVGAAYRCSCYTGWEGTNCSEPHIPSPCDSYPCHNGWCRERGDSYWCSCYQGWTGSNCTESIKTSPCDNYPCRNGWCREQGNSYWCSCHQGWTGSNCNIYSPTPTRSVYTTPTPPDITSETNEGVVHHDFHCDITTVSIHLPVSLAPNSKLTLNDPSCVLKNDGKNYFLNFKLNECGSSISFHNDSIEVKNEINVHKDLGQIFAPVVFDADYRIPIKCSMNRSEILSNVIQTITRTPVVEKEDNHHKHFKYSIREYKTEAYEQEITTTPVQIPLNEEIFIELSTNDSNPHTGIEIEECVATPTNDPYDSTSYGLIRKGCPASPVVHTIASSRVTNRRFKLQAFHFAGSINNDNKVYIHCKVKYCLPRACKTPYCNNRSGRSVRMRYARRMRRSTRSGQDFISFGPMHILQ